MLEYRKREKVRLFPLALVSLFPFFYAPGFEKTQTPEADSYANELIERSRELRLADQYYWHVLLHYKPRWFGGFKSQVDDPSFFLAKNGKTEPESELEATLRAFFLPPETDAEKQHPQCRWIARYHWLKEQLAFDPARLLQHPCPMYAEWLEAISPETVSLIFATYYVNNPASMFGHTLLRFDRSPKTQRPALMAYAANYAATVGRDPGLLYAFKGLTGKYRGAFSIYPYYFKVQEYGNVESRDLWEYRLDLNLKQVNRLMEHLWELGHSYFDYYFIDENCSYHLLGLIEAGDPQRALQSDFRLFVAPSDTVKAIYRQKGLVRSLVYRPSLLSQFRQHLNLLHPKEKDLLVNLIRQKGSLQDVLATQLPLERKALITDAAIRYLAMERQKENPFRQELLSERSNYGSSPDVSNTPVSSPPHKGHESTMWGLGAGVMEDDTYEEIRFRGAFHDLLACDDGYPAHAEVNAVRLRFRLYNEARKFRMEDATVISIVSLFPVDRFFFKASWQAGFGFQREVDPACGRCTTAFIRAGAGLAYNLTLGFRQTIYFFANAYTQMSPWSELEYRLGPQAEGGMIFDFIKAWRLRLFGNYDYSPIGETRTNWRAGGEQRFSLSRNIEFRTDGARFREGWEATGAFQYYY